MTHYRKLRIFSVWTLVAVFGLLFGTSTPIRADSQIVLYGVDSGEDSLYIIDFETGDVTIIGPLSTDPNVFETPVAMAVRPSDGKIFVWNNGNRDPNTGNPIYTYELLTVDRCTGLATEVDPTTPPQGQMGALAFAPDGTLYGFGQIYGNQYGLFTIDTSTGVRTLLWDLGGLRIGAADFDLSGTLWGVEITNSGSPRLVTVDLSTGYVNDVATLTENIVIGSIVFDAYGTLIGSGFDFTTEEDILFYINTETGFVWNPRPVSSKAAPQGMGFALLCSELVPDQVNNVVPSISRECFPSGPFSLYQSFTPKASPLAAVELMFWQGQYFPAEGYSTTVRIRSGTVYGPVLGEATAFIPEGTGGLIHFDFPSPIPVVPGSTYVIEWMTPSPDQHIIYWAGNGDTYAGGEAYGCLETPIPDEDFIFITYSIVNTPEGTDIIVQPEDVTTGEAPVTLTFDEVTQEGTTTLVTSDDGEPLPAGFRLGNPPVYYEISTTAEYSGQIQVCIDYSGITFENGEALTLFHYEDTDGDGVADDWVELITSPGSGTDTICVYVDSLSPFVVVEYDIQIDIKPFSHRNTIRLWNRGLIPVAILSTPVFNAPFDVDRSSLTFGRTGDEQSLEFCLRRGKDVNRDGRRDLICFFRTSRTGFQVGDTEGILKGQTKGGMPIVARDSVRILRHGWWWFWLW